MGKQFTSTYGLNVVLDTDTVIWSPKEIVALRYTPVPNAQTVIKNTWFKQPERSFTFSWQKTESLAPTLFVF